MLPGQPGQSRCQADSRKATRDGDASPLHIAPGCPLGSLPSFLLTGF